MEFLISNDCESPYMKVSIINHKDPQIFVEELTGEGFFLQKDLRLILDLVDVVRKYES